jgi:hypothetical protein
VGSEGMVPILIWYWSIMALIVFVTWAIMRKKK